METAFIEDDMTFTGRIAAAPGIHPEVTFQYRPATIQDRIRLQSNYDNPDKYAELMHDVLTGKLVQWNLDAPIDALTVKRLRPKIKAKMLDIVLEYAASEEAKADTKN